MHEIFDELESVFPARAGMSPSRGGGLNLCRRVPRASGDEPASIARCQSFDECSPRERG